MTAILAPAFIFPFILIVGMLGKAMHPKGLIIFVSTGLPVAAVCGAALFWFAVVGVMFLVVVAQRIASAHQVFGAFDQHIATRAIWTMVPIARSTTPLAWDESLGDGSHDMEFSASTASNSAEANSGPESHLTVCTLGPLLPEFSCLTSVRRNRRSTAAASVTRFMGNAHALRVASSTMIMQ
tara:strand:- start:27 stop:572 length:546 start_codon:yes stop_codon:yes gene_type:complete